MIKFIYIVFFVLASLNSYGQDSITYNWTLHYSFPISENENWNVDGFENYYVSENDILHKYNKEGEQTYSLSVKSLGRMKQLFIVNAMKVVHFSEEQQTLCYFDNTLSSMDDCIDLSEEGVVYASLVCSSNQSNKIWVLDNLNSTLNLLSLDRMNQEQEIHNLKGILNMENISQMKESENRLYLLDKSKGIYIFGIYGSLIEFIPQESIQQFEVVGQTLFTLIENKLVIRALEFDESFTANLPVDEVIEIRHQNNMFYLRTKTNVHKFELVFL